MIVRIKGGLGNQMFQYVFLKQLEKKYGQSDIKADFSFFTIPHDFFEDRLSLLDISVNRATKEDMMKVCMFPHDQQMHTWKYRLPIYIEKVLNKKYYFESAKDRSYKNPAELLKYNVLDGYWQSWRYFNGIEDIIKKDFGILYRCSDETKRQAEEISKTNGVMIGVRKGDYIIGKAKKRFYQIDMDYQIKAAKYIAKRVENPIFYVFANDMKWVHDNLDFGNLNVVYRDPELQVSDLEEMQLMSACKHAIIPNSTFHWFGAFMIDNPHKIIIRPKKYYGDGTPEDVFPPTWMVIE